MNHQPTASAAPSKPSAYAPRWVAYASKILNDLYDDTRSARGDDITKRIMLTSLKTLAKGNALSEKQRATFVESIRVRLGKTGFAWDEPIQLTRSQLQGARDLLCRWTGTKKSTRPDAGIEQLSAGDITLLMRRVEMLERALGELQRDSGSEASSMLPTSCLNPVESTNNTLEMQGLSDLTKHNETERNHGEAMTCLSGDMIAMSPPARGLPAANDSGSSTTEIKENGHRQEGRPNPRGREDQAVVSYFRNNVEREPSANLEILGRRFSLVFHSADFAEEKLRGICTPDWLQRFDVEIGATLRAQSRQHHNSDFRYVLSPIYGEQDSYGNKQPVLPNCVAVLQWSEDGRPQSVILITDDEPTVFLLSPVRQTKPKGPTHKGTVKLAA